MTNSADIDQLASSEANCSGSTVFAKTGHVVFRDMLRQGMWCLAREGLIYHFHTNDPHGLSRPAT